MQSNNIAGIAIKIFSLKFPKTPVVYNVQDIFPLNASLSGNLSKKSILYRILSSMQRYAYKKASHIITISEDMKETLVEEGVDKNKISVIYNWSYQDKMYDIENIDFSNVSQIFNKDKFNVVYAGNIGVMQNVEIIIKAADLLKYEEKIHFHIIGDGVNKNKLYQMSKELMLNNISFWSMMGSEDAPSIYASADVNVIPLIKDVYKTALPSKTATCIACGKPIIFCVGTNSRFVNKAKKEIGCFAVDSDDAEGLKEAILSVYSNPKTFDYGAFFESNLQMSKNSDKYAEIIAQIKK